jgi:molybdopterin-containing oxidoreductase family membrane subunit
MWSRDVQAAKWNATFGLLGLLIALAICSFVYQSARGLGVTGLREPVVWGIYVVNFTFCLGLVAGTLAVLAVVSGCNTTNAAEKFLLSVTALVGAAMAGAFILLDLGRFDRLHYLIMYAQPESPLFWDFIAVATFTVIAVVFCFVTLRQLCLGAGVSGNTSALRRLIYKIATAKSGSGTAKTLNRPIMALVLLLVVGGYFLTTEVFTHLKARPQWHTPVVTLSFFLSASLCGVAALVLIRSFCRRRSEPAKDMKLGLEQKILLFLLAADLIVVLVQYRIGKSGPLASQAHSLFPLSWLVFLVIGNIIPIMLTAFHKQEKAGRHRLVAVLVLVGVLLKRSELIIAAYFSRWLPFAPEASYRPTLPETCIVLGVYSAAVAALMIVLYFAKSIGTEGSYDSGA